MCLISVGQNSVRRRPVTGSPSTQHMEETLWANTRASFWESKCHAGTTADSWRACGCLAYDWIAIGTVGSAWAGSSLSESLHSQKDNEGIWYKYISHIGIWNHLFLTRACFPSFKLCLGQNYCELWKGPTFPRKLQNITVWFQSLKPESWISQEALDQ